MLCSYCVLVAFGVRHCVSSLSFPALQLCMCMYVHMCMHAYGHVSSQWKPHVHLVALYASGPNTGHVTDVIRKQHWGWKMVWGGFIWIGGVRPDLPCRMWWCQVLEKVSVQPSTLPLMAVCLCADAKSGGKHQLTEVPGVQKPSLVLPPLLHKPKCMCLQDSLLLGWF